ncbi:hypothetical protein ACIOHS_44695 [Streptomyces sp. NPDC088253]|uniref:hypothetical protein n=1 Tax=Streptomyces sp. NPDC088253 TaxID=3365846 RepID=UPI003826BA2E
MTATCQIRLAVCHPLGVATTAIRFFQTLGNALGTAVFGSVLARLYAAHGPGGDITALARLTGTTHTDGVHAFTDATQGRVLGRSRTDGPRRAPRAEAAQGR